MESYKKLLGIFDRFFTWTRSMVHVKTSHIVKQSNFQSSIIHFTYAISLPFSARPRPTLWFPIFILIRVMPGLSRNEVVCPKILETDLLQTALWALKELCLLSFSEILICMSRFTHNFVLYIKTLTLITRLNYILKI